MSRGWRIVIALFVLINLVGGIEAIVMGEAPHAVVHAVLLLLGFGVYTGWRARSKARTDQPAVDKQDPRLQYLQESVDAIAVEVERIGEAQRFTEKVMTKQPPANEPPKKS